MLAWPVEQALVNAYVIDRSRPRSITGRWPVLAKALLLCREGTGLIAPSGSKNSHGLRNRPRSSERPTSARRIPLASYASGCRTPRPAGPRASAPRFPEGGVGHKKQHRERRRDAIVTLSSTPSGSLTRSAATVRANSFAKVQPRPVERRPTSAGRHQRMPRRSWTRELKCRHSHPEPVGESALTSRSPSRFAGARYRSPQRTAGPSGSHPECTSFPPARLAMRTRPHEDPPQRGHGRARDRSATRRPSTPGSPSACNAEGDGSRRQRRVDGPLNRLLLHRQPPVRSARGLSGQLSEPMLATP